MNLSVHIPTKKEGNLVDEPFSPIKTNGFGEGNSGSLGQSKQLRPYGSIRQQGRRSVMI